MRAKTLIAIGLSSLYFAITSFAGELPKKSNLLKSNSTTKFVEVGLVSLSVAHTVDQPSLNSTTK